MKIMLSGGGTMGSVSPLIAIIEEIKQSQPDAEFLWLATRHGPEIELLKSYDIPFKEIFAGKLRRYFSFRNLIDPWLVVLGFFQALAALARFKPQAVLSAGGFVSVPVAFAAWLLRRPVIIHQQDIDPGLANKLMAPFATIITVTFPASAAAFPAKKVTVTGNPIRIDLATGTVAAAQIFFSLEPSTPTVLIIGGGTGALGLNVLVEKCIAGLAAFCQIIHITGGKAAAGSQPRYHQYEFLTDTLKDAYAVADVVVSRAGMGVLTELTALRKPAIIFPMPDSHQVSNAREYLRQNAIRVLDERSVSEQQFVAAIKELIDNPAERAYLSRNIAGVIGTDGAAKIAAMII